MDNCENNLCMCSSPFYTSPDVMGLFPHMLLLKVTSLDTSQMSSSHSSLQHALMETLLRILCLSKNFKIIHQIVC